MEALIRLETVAAVPVSSAFDEGACSFDSLFGVDAVVEEEPDADESEDDVDLGA